METISIYKLVDSSQSRVTDNNTTTYLLYFFKKPSIFVNNLYIQIGKAVYSTKFSTFYEVSTCETSSNQPITGMASFVDSNNLRLTATSKYPLDCTLEQLGYCPCLLNKLIQIGCYATRQTELQSVIEHDHILNSKQVSKNILPIPNDIWLKISKNRSFCTIKNVLLYMYDLASAVAYLHENNIAHGDISAINLFILNNKLVLSGFEYFSKFDNENDKRLGIKFVGYPGNMHYPPEFRNPLYSNEFAYKHASFKGDVWSLGLVFVMMLHHYYQYDLTPKLSGLEVGNEVEDYIYQQELSAFFMRPYKKMTPIYPSLMPFKKYIFGFVYYFYNLSKYRLTASAIKDDNFNQTLEQLVEMINSCHNKNPELRPTATEIKDKLSDFISRN